MLKSIFSALETVPFQWLILRMLSGIRQRLFADSGACIYIW